MLFFIYLSFTFFTIVKHIIASIINSITSKSIVNSISYLDCDILSIFIFSPPSNIILNLGISFNVIYVLQL